ncbi:hypothetical protein BaRGS_00020455 [Batillaria attramentaria]|uniref:BTB domain-containing protein n=1 Tax=Batillaria attramentaria TaxID=370345 RepID=A0ABD0KMH7_9CAEN
MNEQQKRLLDGLQEMFETGMLSDVTLVADDTRVSCHRNVLAASSPYFRAMFTSDVSESEQKEVTLQDISGSVLHLLVTYVYSGQVPINNDNVESIMTAASMLQLDTLVRFCEEHMIGALTVENCIEVFCFADFHALQKLRSASKLFVMDNFSDLLDCESLMMLPEKIFEELISADELNVDKEETVYEAVVMWVKYDIENRHKTFTKLFQLVRLPLIDRDYISSDVEPNPLVVRDPYCRGLITISNMYRIGLEASVSAADELEVNVRPRHGMFNKVLLIFSGGAGSESERSFTAYDPDTKKNYLSIRHHPTFDFKFKIDHYRLVVNRDNWIYFVGGIFFDNYHFDEHGEAMATVLRYVQRDGTWKLCTPMNSARCAMAVCTMENKIFAFGGYATFPGFPPLDSCEVYDPEYNEWSILESMPVGIAQHAATAYKDSIFIFGGLDDEEAYLNTVLKFQVGTNTWSLLRTEMFAPRAECSAFTHNNKIFIMGGCNQISNLLSVEVYEPDTNRWHHAEDFPDERKFTSMAQIGDSVYVCGGVRQFVARTGSSRRSRTVESKDLYQYDLLSNTWSHVARMVEHGSNVTCAAALVNVRLLQESQFVST